MRRQNSNEIFYVTGSKIKTWSFAILCWIIAFFLFLLLILFTHSVFEQDNPLQVREFFGPIVLFVLFLPFALGPVIPLMLLRRPIAILTSQGFTGVKTLRHETFQWTPETVIFSINSRLVLANPDRNQTLASKLWRGHKNAVSINLIIGKQKHQDILDAIERLSPYKIRDGGVFGL